jgi:hypothetical protein
VPCTVRYISGNQREELWSATVKTGYCEARAAELVDQVQDWGWHCEQRTGEPPRSP